MWFGGGDDNVSICAHTKKIPVAGRLTLYLNLFRLFFSGVRNFLRDGERKKFSMVIGVVL